MTFDFTLFSTTLDKLIYVILLDGRLKTVAKVGQITLHLSLTLKNVLHVLEFNSNSF